MKENASVSGYFIKSKTRFACFDDGFKIQAQIVRQNKEYSFQKFKKTIIGKLLTLSTSLDETFYDYKIRSIRWVDNNNLEIYYDYRIKKFKNKGCYSILFSSKDIDVFGQNNEFLKSVCDSFGTKKLDLTKHELATEFDFLGRKYFLEINNTLPVPAEMPYRVSFSTFVTVSSNEQIDSDSIFELFKLIKKTISFLAYRSNVDFDFIDLFEKLNSSESLSSVYGDLYLPLKTPNHIFENYVFNKMMKSDSVGSYMNLIIEHIANGTISCDYIPNDSDSYSSVFINTTAWLQCFFREFAKNNPIYKVEGINVKENGNKVSFGNMIDTLVEYSKDYSENIISSKLSLFSFFNNIDEFKTGFTKRIVKMRNDFCHGSVNYGSYKWFKVDLAILQIILYASILKYIGVDKENGDKALMQLFGNF